MERRCLVLCLLALTATTGNCDLAETLNEAYQESLPDVAKEIIDPAPVTDMTLNAGDLGVLTGNGNIIGLSKFVSRITKANVWLLQNVLSFTTTTTFGELNFNLTEIRSGTSVIKGVLSMVCNNVTVSQDFVSKALPPSLTASVISKILPNCIFSSDGFPGEYIEFIKNRENEMKKRLTELVEKVADKLKDYWKRILEKLRPDDT